MDYNRHLRKQTCSIFAMLLALCVMACMIGCSGYHIGSPTLYRQDVRTVYVPMFQSDSYRQQLAERLTEAVVKRIEAVTPYKVVHHPNADTVLSGQIVSDRKRVITEDRFDMARDIEVSLQVEAAWTDRAGNLIGSQFAQPLPAPLITFASSAHFVPEGGQSYATGERDALQKLAKQIVEQMEMPW